jgi:exonuclease SbcC
MRPIRVVMQAFGPYAGRQMVDFRELGDNRFFLIHGPTGSGKTTVLDAMCYALYGTTTGAERTAEQMRSQFAADTLPTEVTFDFAIGEECYRVRRRPAQERAKARGTGTTSIAAEAVVWRRPAGIGDDEDGTPLAVKTREADAEVRRILGFDAEQFRQVVMLPQGRFRELLSAGSGKREEIMQALFATRRYAAIEECLKERKRAVQAGIEDARKLREETLRRAGVSSDEELTELAARGCADLREATDRRDAAYAEAEAAAAALEAGRRAARSVATAAAAQTALAAAESVLETAVLALAQASDALTAEEARGPELVAAQERVRSLEAMQASVGEFEGARKRAEAALRDREARVKDLEAAECVLGAARSRLEENRLAAADAVVASTGLLKAQAALEDATAAVEAVAALDEIAGRVTAAETARDAAAACSDAAAGRATEAVECRDTMLRLWRDGRAAALAAALKPGAPCPVCGSTEHPAPAAAEVAPLSDEEVAAAEKAARVASAEAAAEARRLSVTVSALATVVAEEKTMRRGLKGSGIVGSAAEALEAASAASEQASERARVAVAATDAIAGLEHEAATLAGAMEAARTTLHEADTASKVAAKGLADAERSVPAPMREPGALAAALAGARDMVTVLTDALAVARERSAGAKAAHAAAFATRAERAAAMEASQLEAAGISVPDLPSLGTSANDAALARDVAVAETARLAQVCATHESARARLAELDAGAGMLLGRFETIAALADAATGSNVAKLSFQRYVLGVFLTDVLVSATRRLDAMTNHRYRLHMAAGLRDGRRAGGLDLEVFDEHTGEDRPVATLSGGEGFLASLALALGLAEVVESLAGGVHLDTVFVDEGFGTLDDETLETAIDALMELQGKSRLVGIISHVSELQAVVPARLEVVATPQGSTARFVVP